MGKILVSDRARNVKTLLAKILSDDGHDVIDTSHGPEVLEKAYHEHPDLIIMDLMMQGMDGFEVMGRLSPNPPKDTDGRREDSGRGWVRELQGRWPGVLG